MSIDKSLKLANRLERPRSVLSRAERIAALRDSDKWEEGRSVFGLPKVRVFRVRKKPKAKAAEPAQAGAAADAAAETPEGAEAQPADTAEAGKKKK